MTRLRTSNLRSLLLLSCAISAACGSGPSTGPAGNGADASTSGADAATSGADAATNGSIDGSTAATVPTALVATAGDAQVFLGWSAASAATSYHVKRATKSGGPYTQIAAPASNAYNDTGLTNGTTYYYVVSALGSAGESANSTEANATPAPVSKTCGMQLGDTPVTFCEPFDAPAGIGSRSGDLDGNVWGVSRTYGSVNYGGHTSNPFPEVTISTCNGDKVVRPPNDVVICNGQLREATNDNTSGQFEAGTVTDLAMYPKQPFDFAGRTGTVSFDVSNDGHGSHATWPEFWMSNLPVPAPFNHFDSWESLPEHGFGVRFEAQAPPNNGGVCQNGNNLDKPRWTVGSAVAVRNYVMEDINNERVNYGPASGMKLTILDCVIAPPDGSGLMNHIELKVSQSGIDIYATDAGVAASPTTLRKIASLTNANFTFTRGLIWLEDAHYNADKGVLPSEKQHTFVWDNVAFDGPFTYRDFAYDAPDSMDLNDDGSSTWNGQPTANLGKLSDAGKTATWSVPGLPANPKGTAARVLFNFSNILLPNAVTLNVTVNGHAHPTPWPYPDQMGSSWRTFAVTIPITDLVAGTNTVELGSDVGMISSNVDIVLVDVQGGVPVLPGNSRTYPSP